MERRARSLVIALLVLAVVSVAALPALAAPGSAPQRQGTVHIVQWGETLGIIAQRYGVTVSQIAQANGIANPNYIYAGQRLNIPTGTAPPPPAPPPGSTTTYVVQRGDTMGAIAARYGTTVNEMASLNCLMNPNLIYVGQRLYIP